MLNDQQKSLASKTRHDLHNAIGHILGFAEMLLEDAAEQSRAQLQQHLEAINRAAGQMIAKVNEGLTEAALQAGVDHLPGLEQELCELADRIIAATNNLDGQAPHNAKETFRSDLGRIAGAARHAQNLARNGLAACFDVAQASLPGDSTGIPPCVNDFCLGEFGDQEARPPGFREYLSDQPSPLVGVAVQPSGSEATPRETGEDACATRKQGVILVVDDMEENRQLLWRRLSRLGYSVQLAENGELALEAIRVSAPDLVLLDVLMPGLDGVQVLQRLKAASESRHIPVIMLSSAGEIDTVVRCINLGADDFLPKPFNATLLMARIESSLSKKRLRDQETEFLQQLQAERDTSERLLLNILPKPIAQRLKLGESTIADHFPEVTVLFSDFAGFTRLSAGISASELVGRLNGFFSAFDRLCEHHGLEKIKTIGDAYLAVAGLPKPLPDAAKAAAELALAMQEEVAHSIAGAGLPWRMRIGLNTGPVVAGVIGTRKFAYDLWGDTVNLASRMQSHAPRGGVLVTAPTYERLRDSYAFKPGRIIRVKGKGQVLSYLLLGRDQPHRA